MRDKIDTRNYSPEALVILACLSLPCLLFYIFIGKIFFCLAVAMMTIATLPFFRTTVEETYLIASQHRTLVPLACAIAAIALTTIGGEGRLFPAQMDWLIRDAVLHDLVQRPWPFVYQLDGTTWALRAPLGMYLVPALVGKLAGLYSAYLALWLQNSLAIFAVLRIFCASANVARSITVLVVICIFSGLDTVGAIGIAVARMFSFHTSFYLPPTGWWAVLFQYSSTMTLAFWVPNHALAGWFFTALLLLWDRRRIGISALFAGAVLSAFWSPFALMGGTPFLAKAGLEALLRGRFTWRDLGAPLILVLTIVPLGLYMLSDSAAVPKGFEPFTLKFLIRYTAFLSVEVLPFVIINFIFGDNQSGFSRSTYALAIISLVLIPLYRLGLGNDFVMRASIPALAILAITTGHSAYNALNKGTRTQATIVALVLGVGFLTGIDQLEQIFMAHNAGISTCDLVQAWDQDPAAVTSKASYLAAQDRLSPLIRPSHPKVYMTGPTSTRCSQLRLKPTLGALF